jgi:hypothetical protein
MAVDIRLVWDGFFLCSLKWESLSRVAETPEQFTFYGARTVAKVIEKSKFSSRQELLTFRRMVRRHVADNELLHN